MRACSSLRTIPGVGPRLAEAIVTMFDDVTRFATAGQVGAYIGMVPKQYDSGETARSGRITRHGNRLVRSLLVEIGWASPRYNPLARQTFQRISGGLKRRFGKLIEMTKSSRVNLRTEPRG